MISNDLELLQRIQKSDENAFELLFRAYYKPLCQFSYKIVKDTIVAEEIVQEIFFHFWEKRQSLELFLSVKSYLYKAVHNNSLKYLRHQKIVIDYETRIKMNLSDAFDLQENYAEMGEISQIILETLASVSERSRDIFRLNRDEGLKYQEIAEQLNISVKTVEAHISSLLKLFRENLKDYLFIGFIFILNFLG